MQRKIITEEKLNGFISAAKHMCGIIESPIDPGIVKDIDAEELDRIMLMCTFLRDANESDVINLDYMSVQHFVTHGVRIEQHHFWGEVFVPDRKRSLSRYNTPALKSHVQYFSDAVKHVARMAKAIKTEASSHQTSQRVLNPYNGRADGWQPAQLTA